MRTVMAPLVRCALVIGLLLSAAGCGSGPGHGRVTIMVPWSGAEFRAFYAVIERFEADTGVQVDVQVTRDLTQQLDAAVAASAPPDLAVLPSVGAIYEYSEAGKLQPLDLSTGAYLQPFRTLTEREDKVYAVPVKVDVKSLIWFDPDVMTRRPPTSPAALRTLSQQNPGIWCLGLESGPTSGWPGADWIADILLAEQGSGVYEKWLSGKLPWKSEEVAAAWDTWRELIGTSAEAAATRNFGAVAREMNAKPPTCSLAHGALSAMGFTTGRHDFVPYSTTRRLEVSGDFVGMFTRGNQSAEDLIAYLAGSEAQQLWVRQRGGYAFSANRDVTQYNDGLRPQIARMLQPGSGYTLCFSAADAMQPDVSAAFYRAVLEYARDNPPELSDLLEGLDNVQDELGDSRVPTRNICST